MTGDIFKARFADCQFNETNFPTLGGDKITPEKDRNQCELKVQKIIHLQKVANTSPDAFTNVKTVTKSHIPAINAPCKINLTDEDIGSKLASESKTRQKRGRPIGSKDKNPRKRKVQDNQINASTTIPKENDMNHEETSLKDNEIPKTNDNEEISINYVISGKRWNRNEIIVDSIFAILWL
ncbi:hypothetical protein QQ045_030427 [Rhodiola kirilowii]